MFVKRILNPSKRAYSTFKRQIDEQIIKRNKVAIPPEILTYEQVELLCKELIQPEEEEKDFLLDQITNRIVPGVDKTSRLKANFLYDICLDKLHSPLIDKDRAIKLLGSMQGGYSIEALLKLLDNNKLSQLASAELKNNILIFDYFYEIEKLHHQGNSNASDVLKSWANAEWFLNKKPIPDVSCLTILFLRCINFDKSKSTLPVEIPCSSACLEISVNFSDEFNKAFDGMQPILRQVPPSVFSFSTHATFIPS